MKLWGLRQWDLRVEVLVSSTIDVESMPALQGQLRTLLPEKNPGDPVWTSLLKEVQGRRILRARMVLTAGSPGVAVDRALEVLQAASHALDVGVIDVEQVSVAPTSLTFFAQWVRPWVHNSGISPNLAPSCAPTRRCVPG